MLPLIRSSEVAEQVAPASFVGPFGRISLRGFVGDCGL